MPESNPGALYGVHDVRFYDYLTGETLSHLRVLGDVNPEFSAEMERLMGGSQMYPWETRVKEFKSTLKITAREYSGSTMKLLLGGELTEYSADENGDVLDIKNINGNSLVNEAAGISQIVVNPSYKDNLKEGWYLLKAVSNNSINIYGFSDVNLGRGTKAKFLDDEGRINEEPITIGNSDNSINKLGIKIISGSGTTNFVLGDTARFYVQKPHGYAYEVRIGQKSLDFKKVGVVIAGQLNNGEVTYMHFFKCQAAGMNTPFTEKGYAQYEITIEPEYDTLEDAVAVFRRSAA